MVDWIEIFGYKHTRDILSGGKYRRSNEPSAIIDHASAFGYLNCLTRHEN
jgi:hypothetical protein